jgi:hypothetical protein
MGEEADALNDMMEDGLDDDELEGSDFFGMPPRPSFKSISRQAANVISAERRLALYNTAKAAKTGTQCVCPSCQKQFTKKSYQQAFCSNKGRNNCKDVFWNRASPELSERAQNFSGRR